MAESLRAEAARRGVSTYQVRVERAEARGFTGGQARRLGAGKPQGEEMGLRSLRAVAEMRANPSREAGQRASRALATEARRLGITVHQAWTLFVASPPTKPAGE